MVEVIELLILFGGHFLYICKHLRHKHYQYNYKQNRKYQADDRGNNAGGRYASACGYMFGFVNYTENDADDRHQKQGVDNKIKYARANGNYTQHQ